MRRVMPKQRTSGSVFLAVTALFAMFIQALGSHCICGPSCAMWQEIAAQSNHACCEAVHDTSSTKPVSDANLVRKCNCPPKMHEAAPVIANAPEHGHEHFKHFAVASLLSPVVAVGDFGHIAISESPPPKQGVIILKRSLRC